MAIRKKIEALEDVQGFDLQSLYNQIPQGIVDGVNAVQRATTIDYADLVNRWTTPLITNVGTIALDYMKFYYEIPKVTTTVKGKTGTDNAFKRVVRKAGDSASSIGRNFQDNITLASNKLLWADNPLRELVLFDIYVSVSQDYNTVETTPAGFIGCISEYISTGPMMLSFRGKLVGSTDFQQDHFSIMKMKSIFGQKEYPVKILNSYLNRVFSVDELIIKSFNIDEYEENSNMNSFTINAIAYNYNNESSILQSVTL